jgi:UDP-glucose 4-epimerase
MKTVLITGGYGFIGRYTAHFFSGRGWNVIGLGHGDWSTNEWRNWGIREWHTCDITLDSLLTYAGIPDVIVHCAGSGTVGFSVAHPFQDHQRTVVTTLNVLEFTRLHAPGARVIYPSSTAVYGMVVKQPISEVTELNPASPYGVHKKQAEDLCRSYARHFGVSTAIVRLFSVYGIELRKQLLWEACSKICNDETTFGGTGQETRDWLHVNDAASLLFEAGKHASSECPAVNGGSGISVTVYDVIATIFSCFGRTDLPVFNGMMRPGNPVHYRADITRAREWGWEPEINWRVGIEEYVAWFKKEYA